MRGKNLDTVELSGQHPMRLYHVAQTIFYEKKLESMGIGHNHSIPHTLILPFSELRRYSSFLVN